VNKKKGNPMLQPKLRRAVASAALLSALSLLPAHAAAPRSPRSEPARSERNAVVRLVAPVWDLVTDLLRKASVRIDPDGNRLTVRTESDGNAPSGSPNGSN
jgi:hypothetical protein